MLKQITTALALITSSLAFSQVGIQTQTPHASADLELGSVNKTLYLNRVANPETDIVNPQEGMILYDTTMKCLRAYQGEPAGWSDCLAGSGQGSGTGTITTLTCGSAVFSPASATVGQEYSGTLTVPYTGGNGGNYTAVYFTVNGLTFFLPPGNFETGNGTLRYNITGMPTTAGSTSIEINIGGQSCSGANALSLQVNPATNNPGGVLTPDITLQQNRVHWIAAIYDTDYLPYTAPTAPASTATVNADGSPETTVNIPASITTAGVTVQIPVQSVTGSGTINAWSHILTIPAALAQDGISREVELLWASQSYTAATTNITATIRSIGGTLNVKQLDINAGLGNDFMGVLMATFQYPYNSTGNLTTYELRDIPGIPDKMFGQYDNDGVASGYRHNFLYLPVMAEDGKIWLNNNLGADYAKLGGSNFNITRQATSASDFRAFGSLFQYGRKPDGHELINWTSNISGTPVNTLLSVSRSNNPTHSLLIALTGTPYNWRASGFDDSLWKNESSPNNPCPSGFRVPTISETTYWVSIVATNATNFGYNTALKLPNVGWRSGNTPTGGYMNYSGVMYSTSSAYPTVQTRPVLSLESSFSSQAYRSDAIAVRCIMD